MTSIAIHGGGYVGLTGAIHAALAGYEVIIYDPDKSVTEAINSGTPKANEYLEYLNADIIKLIKDGKLQATSDFFVAMIAKVHFIAVPTEKNDLPYLDLVKKVVNQIATNLPAGGLIIIESTLQPGTTDEILEILPDHVKLAVCPRLDWFADKEKNITNLPRIVGGINQASTDAAVEILKPICKDIHPTTYRVAEMAKAGQNALYFAQIMKAHILAYNYANFVDMNEVLKAIGIHWRLPNLYLGPGTSGRCVAMGAKYLDAGLRSKYVNGIQYDIFGEELKEDYIWRCVIANKLYKTMLSPILIMGVSYCPNFSDFGYSAGLDIAKICNTFEPTIYIHDPIVSKETLSKATLIPFKPLSQDINCILLATGHDVYKDLPLNIDLWKKGQYVLDATGLWEKYRGIFIGYGVTYVRVGEKGWLSK